jgi:hypothetical protein
MKKKRKKYKFIKIRQKHVLMFEIRVIKLKKIVTLESRLYNSGVDQSFPVFIQSGFILHFFFVHSYFTILPAFLHLSI